MADIEFIDARKQESPATLPGDNENARNTLGDIVKDRAAYYKKITDEIYEGKKAEVDTRSNGGKWYHQQIEEMTKYGYIPQTKDVYVEDRPLNHVLGYNPTSHYLVKAKTEIKEKLSPDLKDFVRIAGTDFANRSNITMRNARERSLFTIAPSGDLNTLKEIVDTIDAKIRENRRNLTLPPDEQRHHERDYSLVIENIPVNGVNYWDGLLRGIKILDYNENIRENGKDLRQYVNLKDLASMYGIYVTESREQTLKLADKLGKQAHKAYPDKTLQPEPPIVPDNSIIYVATGTRKKFDILEQIYKKRGVNVRVRPIYELTDTYMGPEENTRTYEGNVAKKIDAAVEAWELMDIRTRHARLGKIAAECKIKESDIEKHIFFLGEDSGFEFVKDGVLQDQRFDDIQGLDPKARQPGVETGPTIFAKHGVAEFFRKAGEIIPENERGVLQRSVIALAPLKGDEYGKRPKYMVVSEQKGHFITHPQPANGALEIDNFLVPEGRKETEATLMARGDDYTIKDSAKALAWEGIALETGIKLNSKGIKDDYSRDFVTGIVRGESKSSNILSDKLEKQNHGDGFGIINLHARVDKAADVQKEMLAKSDAIVLAFDPEKAQEDFWQNTYTFLSMIVGEQTHDKFKLSKPLKLLNPKKNGKGAFDYLEDLVQDFHMMGTIAQDPATLYTSVNTIEEAIGQLKEERKEYRRMRIPTYASAEHPNPVDGSISRKDFNVAVFCSATSKNIKYINEVHELTEKIIKSDFGLVSGAGLYSAMGEITHLAHELRHSLDAAHHSGSNVRHLMLVEGDARDKLDQFLLARNIYERMEFMMDNSDAFVIAPGGAGTVQEMSLLALLKKRAVENKDDKYAQEKMAGKDIIILNSKIPYNGGMHGFYDKLIEIIPKEDFDKLGIHVVDTVEQAHNLLRDIRSSKRMEKSTNYKEDSGYSARISSQREAMENRSTLY